MTIPLRCDCPAAATYNIDTLCGNPYRIKYSPQYHDSIGGHREERIFGWLTNFVGSIGDSIRENVRTIGGAFCGLFIFSLVICSVVVYWYGDDWDSQGPVGIVADISGASFAMAIVILSAGRVAMVMTRIFKRREKEEGREEGRREGRREGREEGREEGRRETANEFTEADAQRKPGETLQQAVERLRRGKAKEE